MPSGKGTYGSKRGRPAKKATKKTTKKVSRVLALTKARKIANAGRTKPPTGTELGGVPGITTYRNLRKKAAAKKKTRKKK